MKDHARDLIDFTLQWSLPWWDYEEHMVWNPPGSMDEYVPERTFHLVPNTAWLAFGMLASADVSLHREAAAAIAALIDLQYDDPSAVFHGTFAQFLESRYPPAKAQMWIDYDPNWRQFVGTTFALAIEDHAEQLGPELVEGMLSSIGLAVAGEPDGRIPVHYTNPALMRSWLDAWYGTRSGDRDLIARGETFAGEIVALHDRHNAFDEYNSPTYSGIDLYALALWTAFAPTPLFADAGRHLTAALWEQGDDFYHPSLRNWCGPFTRSYHPDATQSVTLLALWKWARDGRDALPMPNLDTFPIDHCHDMMAGAVIGRLAGEIPLVTTQRALPRTVRHSLGNERFVEATLHHDWMVGAESSTNDWGGWSQYMPFVAHWQHGDAIATLWWHAPETARATLHDNEIHLASDAFTITLRVCGAQPELNTTALRIGPWLAITDADTDVHCNEVGNGILELSVARCERAVAIIFVREPRDGESHK